MKLGMVRINRTLAFCAAVVGTLAWFGAFIPAASAAPTAAEVRLSALRTIQTYNLEKQGLDDVYLLVTGVAKGQEFQKRFPEEGTLQSGRKQPAVVEDEPLTLWKGELADGEFALVTVTLMHGKGQDQAKAKEYLDKLQATVKKPEARAKKTLANRTEMTKLATDTLAAEQEVITNIKEIFAREKNTDHYGGLFTVLVWNNGEKLMKRVDPVGLTFGEHYGIDVKIYSKIKNTLKNVLTEEGGVWAEDRLTPLGEDDKAIRVKMLETEFFKAGTRDVRNVTDYLADIQVLAAGKPLRWSLGGEVPPSESGDPETHTYWGFAE